MEVKFYKGFVKKENSTLQPVSSSITIECYMKRETSILTPTLVLDVDYKQTYFDYNYFKMDNRYYWVTDVVLGNNNIIEISGKVDVLASWKQYIGNTITYISRSSHSADGNIKDDMYPLSNKVTWVQQSANPQNIFNWTSLDSGFFVLAINNSAHAANVGTTSHYILTQTQMNSFCNKLMNYSDGTPLSWIGGDVTEDMTLDLFKTLFNPIQYIMSAMWFPISLDDIDSKVYIGGADAGLAFGNWQIDMSDVGFYVPTNPVKHLAQLFNMVRHPKADTRHRYLNDAPYSEYYIYVMPFGTIELDPSSFRDGEQPIVVDYDIDLFSGTCTCRVTGRKLENPTLATNFTQKIITTKLAIDVSLTQITHDYLAQGSAMAGFSLSINPAASVSSFGQSLIGYTRASAPVTQTIGSSGGSFSALNTPQYMMCKFTDPVPFDDTLFGCPLCQIKKISDIPGYVQCLESDDLLAPATEPELSEIREHMTSGFFYE